MRAAAPQVDCAVADEQTTVGGTWLTICAVIVQLALSEEASDKATHVMTRPLLESELDMEMVPSAFSVQPTAPAGHEQTTRGADDEHGSEP